MPRSIFHPDQYLKFANLAEAFFFNAEAVAELPAYDQAAIDPADDRQPRRYERTLHRQMKERVLRLAAGLEACGAQAGDSVAILSLDRPEWSEAEMAIHTVGARMVGAYVRDPLDRLHHILCDSEAKYIFAENQEQLEKVLRLTGHLPHPPGGDPELDGLPNLGLKGIITFEQTELPPNCVLPVPPVKSLAEILAEQPVRPARTFRGVYSEREAIACIFYTSASTGLPKGVPVTHGQTLENLRQIAAAKLVDYEQLVDDPGAVQPVIMSLLPERAHVYAARVMQLVATSPLLGRYPAIVDRRSSQISPQFRESWRRDLLEGGAHIVIVVPKILIALEKRVRQGLAGGGWREQLAARVVANAQRKLAAEARGQANVAANLAYRALSPVRKRVAQQIRDRIVGRDFRFFVCGGAKLPVETGAFLWAIGMPVFEGYGSTETNCPIAVGTPHSWRLGTVGRLFSGIEAKVDPQTRELLIRGPNVAQGYWRLPAQTAATWTPDGWYHTRDIGRIDADGFLHIEDRLDNILVLLNGEKVSAAEIEGRFASIPLVETAIVIGHQRPGLVALVAVNEHAVRQARREHAATAGDLAGDQSLRDLLWSEIQEKVNCRASRGFERICNFAMIDPLHPEQRTLTATEKVPRQEIESKYKALIERLYAECEMGLDGQIAASAQLQRAAAA